MASEDGEHYIISDAGDEVWARPTPVRTAIVEAVTEGTDLEADDLDDVEAYVDIEDLHDVLSSEDGVVTFEIEGHEVFVDAGGDIEIAE